MSLSDTVIKIELPEVIKNFWIAQQVLVEHYVNTALRFTLGGRLVGNIADPTDGLTLSFGQPKELKR